MTFYDFAARLVRGIFRIISRFEVTGRQHLPSTGPYIVACNHTFALDSVYLGVGLYPTPVHFLSKQENLEIPVIGPILKRLNVYGVNRQNPGPSFIKHTLSVLKAGGVVGIFPEGTRSVDGQALKSGAVRIAMKAGVPIVPAFYDGPNTFGAFWKRPKVAIRFGPPIHLTKGTVTEEQLEQLLSDLSSAMRSLRQAG